MANILIVDDDISVAFSLEYVLRLAQHQVVTALSGRQGLELAQAHPVELALVDAHMPGMDGYTVCRRLRERSPALPVLMISAVPTSGAATQAQLAGATCLLRKPFDVEHLLAVIASTLAPKPAADAAATLPGPADPAGAAPA